MENINRAAVDAIKSVSTHTDAAWEAGDSEGFIDAFTDDVVWMPPGDSDIVGKEACATVAQSILEGTNFEQVATRSEEIVVIGDWAFERFRASWDSTPKAGGETTSAEFRGFRILQEQGDGSWKVAQYIWN